MFNDALRIRAEAYEAGLPYITDADLSGPAGRRQGHPVRLHRSLARKQPGSSNGDKARVALARAHAEAAEAVVDAARGGDDQLA